MSSIIPLGAGAWFFIGVYLLSLILVGFIARRARLENTLLDFYLAGPGFGASAFTVLVPADLTRAMIRVAFEESKIAAGVDIAPLFSAFAAKGRPWELPQLPRRTNHTKSDRR